VGVVELFFSSDKFSQFYEEAKQEFENGNLDRARFLLLKALELVYTIEERQRVEELLDRVNKRLGSYLYRRAKDLLLAGEYLKAWEFARTVLELGIEEKDAEGFANLVDEIRNKLEESERLGFIEPYLERASEFEENGNFEEAIVELKEAVAMLEGLNTPKYDELVDRIAELEEKVVERIMKNYNPEDDFSALKTVDAALAVVDFNAELKKKLIDLLLKHRKNIAEQKAKDPDFEKLEVDDIVREYERAIGLYFNMPHSPGLGFELRNPYKEYVDALRRKLAIAIGRKADLEFRKGRRKKALEYYKLAHKYSEGLNMPERVYFQKMITNLEK